MGNFKTIFTLIIWVGISIVTNNMQAQGFLHADGKRIVNGSGENVLIRSIGTGNWMIQEGYMMQSSGAGIHTQWQFREKLVETIGETLTDSFYNTWLANGFTKADLDAMKAWGFNAVRPAIHYKWFTLPIEDEPVVGENTWLSKGFTMLDSLVAWCTENQMYVIIDMHGAPGGQGKNADISDYDPSKESLWESERNKQKLTALWYKIAERYKDEPWVGGYDLINETNWDFENSGNENGCNCNQNIPLIQMFERIIDTIRLVDNNHLVMVSGNCWGNNYNGMDGLAGYDNNLAFTFHKYWSYNDYGSIWSMIDRRDRLNVPLWMSESGENSNTWFTNAIRLFEDNNIGWSWWPVKKAGFNNVLQVETNQSYTNLINFWATGSPSMTSQEVFNAVMSFAENHKFENCNIKTDVIDAIIRQVHSTGTEPYKNHAIRDTVFCTNYDYGRNNHAYYDTDTANYKTSTGTFTSWNQGWSYRNDGVDIQWCSDTGESTNNYNVGWTNDGEWLKYTIESHSPATYNLSLRHASGNASGAKVHFEANGQTVSDTVQLPGTGDWQTWESYNFTDISLPAGTLNIKLVVDVGGSNLSYFRLYTTDKQNAWLSNIQVNGSNLIGFSANSNQLSYNYGLPSGTTVVPTVTVNTENASASHVITNATSIPGTTTIEVTAADGTTKKTYEVHFSITHPGNVATTPLNRLSSNVISVYSDAYENIANASFDQNWGIGSFSELDISGNAIAKYENLMWNGIIPENDINASDMEYLHIDLWTADADAAKVVLNNNANAQYNFTFSKYEWNSFDIPMSNFSNVANAINEIKFEDSNGKTIFLDNIYFYKRNNDASLSDIKVSGTKITGFSASELNYTVALPYGTVEIPELSVTTNDENASYVINKASALPGTTSIDVISENTTDSKTYNVSFTVMPNTDARLSSILVNNVELTGFNADSLVYYYELPYSSNTIPQVNAFAIDTNATVSIDAATQIPGTTSIWVTAADNATTKTYTVHFTKAAASTNASLSSLTLNGITLNGFHKDSLHYSVELPYGSTEVPMVNAIVADSNATINLDQAASITDKAIITVTAQDGITRLVYTIAFKVAAEISSDASLSDIQIDGVSLTDFASNIYLYEVTLPYGTDVVPITTGFSSNMAATVLVTNATSISDTTVIQVTAQDSVSVLVYKIVFKLDDPIYQVLFTVIDQNSRLIEDAKVIMLGDTVFTDSNGLAVFDSVSPNNNIAYTVFKQGFIQHIDSLSLTDSTVSKSITLMPELHQVSLQITDEQNNAIAGAQVVFLNDTVFSDSIGYAVFSNVLPVENAKYEVSKEKYEVYQDSVTITDSDVNEKVVLQLVSYQLAFNVIDTSGFAVHEASVTCAGTTLLTDTHGTAIFENMVPTEHLQYQVQKEGYFSFSDSVTISDSNKVVTIVLQPEVYQVTFKVIDADSLAVAGAHIVFSNDTVSTDSSGVAVFNSISPVQNAVYSIYKEGFEDFSGTCSVNESDITVNCMLNFVVLPTYSVTFSLTANNGEPIQDAMVIFLGDTIFTNEQGNAVFEEVDPVDNVNYTIIKEGYELITGTVTITDANKLVYVQMITSSIFEELKHLGRIYPNPTSGILNIELANAFNKAVAKVYNAQGQMVEHKELFEMNSKLDLSSTKAGVYLLNIELEGQLYYARIVINR